MFIFAADVHLDLNTWNSNKAIRGDSLYSLECLFHIARTHDNIPIILGGDVFDTKLVHPELAHKVRQLKDKYPEVTIYYVNGNHDPLEPSWTSLLLDGIHLTNQPIKIGGLNVAGLDWQLTTEFANKVATVSHADILIAHQTFDCFCNTPSAVPFSAVDRFRLTLAGDYHISGTYVNTSNGNTIVAPGSTNRRTVSEGIPSFLFVGGWDTYNLDFQNLPGRQLVTVDINDTEEAVDEALTVQDLHPTYKCDFESEYKPDKPLIVFRGKITEDLRKQWHASKFADSCHLLFVPSVVRAENVDSAINLVETQVRGSKQYIYDVLAEYPNSDHVKQLTADLVFGDPDKFFGKVKEKFNL